MPSLRGRTPPTPTPTPAHVKRLYHSAHLRFRDLHTSPSALSSHHRALLLDAGDLAHRVWHFVECVQLLPAGGALRRWVDLPRGGFWHVVVGLVLRGLCSEALKMVTGRLRDCPDWPSRVASLRLRDGVVDPLAALEYCLNVPERGEWPAWQAVCAAWAGSEELVQHREVRDVMAVLAGELDTIERVAPDWETVFVACVMYRGGVREAVIDASEVKDLPEYGLIYQKVAADELPEALELIHDEISPFHAAHLSDLLHRAGKIEAQVREHYLLSYAEFLQPVSWRLAAEYYLHLSATPQLVTLLSTVPVAGAGDPTAEKLLLVAGRVKASEGVCERVGTLCRHVGNFGGAMAWFGRGALNDLAEEVAGTVLALAEVGGVCSKGATQLAYVVAALAKFGNVDLKQRLSYAVSYHEMQEAAAVIGETSSEAEINEYGTSVRALLSPSGGLPRKHWCVIAYDAAGLIRMNEKMPWILGKRVLYDLLVALQTPGNTNALASRLRNSASPMSTVEALRQARETLVKSVAGVIA